MRLTVSVTATGGPAPWLPLSAETPSPFPVEVATRWSRHADAAPPAASQRPFELIERPGDGQPAPDADDDPPVGREVVQPPDVAMELGVVLPVLLAVVLQQHAVRPEDEVAVRGPPRGEPDRSVELRLGEPGAQHPQAQARLPPRRRSPADVTARRAQPPRTVTGPEPLDRCIELIERDDGRAPSHEPVARGHEVVVAEVRGELAPRVGSGDEGEAREVRGADAAAEPMSDDPHDAGLAERRRRGHVERQRSPARQGQAPQLRGRFVAEHVARRHPLGVRAAQVDELLGSADCPDSAERGGEVAGPETPPRHAEFHGAAHVEGSGLQFARERGGSSHADTVSDGDTSCVASARLVRFERVVIDVEEYSPAAARHRVATSAGNSGPVPGRSGKAGEGRKGRREGGAQGGRGAGTEGRAEGRNRGREGWVESSALKFHGVDLTPIGCRCET